MTHHHGDGVGGAFAAEITNSTKMTIAQIKAAQAAELARVQAKHAEELQRLEMLERAENLRLVTEAAANAQAAEAAANLATVALVAPQAAAQEQRTSGALAKQEQMLAKKPTGPPGEVAKKWSEELQVLELAFTDTIQSRCTHTHTQRRPKSLFSGKWRMA